MRNLTDIQAKTEKLKVLSEIQKKYFSILLGKDYFTVKLKYTTESLKAWLKAFTRNINGSYQIPNTLKIEFDILLLNEFGVNTQEIHIHP